MAGIVKSRASCVAVLCEGVARCRTAMPVQDHAEPWCVEIPQRTIAQGGQRRSRRCIESARRFVEDGPAGLADRREDNGDAKVTEEYEADVDEVVAKSPRNYGYRRPTWTQELLVLVLAKRTGIRISCTTMSRVLEAAANSLGTAQAHRGMSRGRKPAKPGVCEL